jgi:protein O-mannosyl-transferase
MTARRLAAVLCLVTLAVWWPVLGNDFAFDDVIDLVLNERVHDWSTAWQAFAHPFNWGTNAQGHLQTYRPLVLVSHVVTYHLFGLRPLGHHVVRVLLHVGVALLTFAFFRRWLASPRLAFAIALVFAIHPACVEAIHSPSGDLYLALFGLAALLLSTAPQPRAWHALPIGVLLAMSMLAKEGGVLYALLAPLFAELTRRRTQPARPRSSLAPVVAAAVVSIAVYAGMRHHALGEQSLPSNASVGRLADAVTGVWFFATQALVAPLARAPAILDFAAVPRADRLGWYALAACNVFVAALLLRRRRALEAICFLWWLASLAPSAAVMLTEAVWPGLYRWLYMGMPGILLTIAGTLAPWLAGRRRRLMLAAWALVCAALGLLSVRATRAWRNDVTLFSAMALESPDHFWAYRRLGWALYYRARFADALPVLQRAAELAPADERDSCIGLWAASLAGADDCDGAVKLFVAHAPTPMMSVDHFAFVAGACFERRGSVERALQLYRACGAGEPRCAAAVERLTQPAGAVTPLADKPM